MFKFSIFQIDNTLLLKNLAYVYWHIAGVIIWLQVLIALGGFCMAISDNKTLSESMYMAYVTSLTIGFGDITPETGISKFIAILVGFLGIIFTGLVVAASLKALEMTIAKQKH